MTKKHFIELADFIKMAPIHFDKDALDILAGFCKAQNSNFNKERWLDYIAGKCGPNGGEVKRLVHPELTYKSAFNNPNR